MGYLLPLLVAALALVARAAPAKSSSSASHSSGKASATGKPSGSSGPPPSGDDADNNIQDLVGAGIMAAVDKTGGLGDNIFYALDGWRALSVDEDTDENEFNQIIFEASDGVPSRNGSEGSEISFSQQFVNYVQDMNIAMVDATSDSPRDSKKLNSLANKQGEACLEILANGTLDEAVHAYQVQRLFSRFLHIGIQVPGKRKSRDASANSTDGGSDSLTTWRTPDFIEWAKGQKDYSGPIMDCLEADSAYQEEYNKVYGNNFDLVSATSDHIRPLVDDTGDAAPGINMKIADADQSIFPGAVKGQYAPQYSIPVLKGTLKTWTDPKDNKTTDFTWSSKNVTNGTEPKSEPKDSKDEGAKRRRFAIDARRVLPANTSRQEADDMKKTFKAESLLKSGALRYGTLKPKIGVTVPLPRTNGTAESFQLSFKRVMRMDIQLGNWFDNYATAKAISQANGSDPITNAARPVLKEYFGTKQEPGNAAFYNLQALVVYQPAWQYSLKTTEAAEQLNSTLRAATKVKDNNVLFNDTSTNAYIVGYIQTPFWK